MPELVLSCAAIRAAEAKAIEQFGISSLVLMENAGRNIAALLLSLGVHGRVTILCGKGNNGGDGLVIARHLDNSGCDVRILLFAQPSDLSPDTRTNYEILARSGVAVKVLPSDLRAELAGSDWIVDALFGTGLKGPLNAPFDDVVSQVNASGIKVMAVDIPSGLDGDTGEPLGPTIRAQHTATMLAWKQGFLSESARPWIGQVHLIDIGLPRKWREYESE